MVSQAAHQERDESFLNRFSRTIMAVPGARLAVVPGRIAAITTRAYMLSRHGDAEENAPVARPTPRFIASVAMDELVLGLASGRSRIPEESELERVGSQLRTAWRMYDRQGWIEEPRNYHRNPRPANPVVEHKRWLSTSYEHLRWPSGYRPHDDEPGAAQWMMHKNNETAHAYVLRHPEPDRPWLVCIHGLGMGFPAADFMAFRAQHLFDHYGVNIAIPVLPLHGPRRDGLRPDQFLTHDLMAAVHGMAHAMWDVRSLIGWIRENGTGPIGVHGISLGGYSTALVSTLEEDLRLAMAGVPLVDLPSLFDYHAPSHLRGDAVTAGLLGQTTHEVHRVVSPLAMTSNVQHEDRAVYGGLADRLTTVEQAHRLWLHWGRPEARWYEGNHMTVPFNKDVIEFVDERLSRWLGVTQPPAAATA